MIVCTQLTAPKCFIQFECVMMQLIETRSEFVWFWRTVGSFVWHSWITYYLCASAKITAMYKLTDFSCALGYSLQYNYVHIRVYRFLLLPFVKYEIIHHMYHKTNAALLYIFIWNTKIAWKCCLVGTPDYNKKILYLKPNTQKFNIINEKNRLLYWLLSVRTIKKLWFCSVHLFKQIQC